MGRDLAERFPAARAVFEEADAALGVPLSRVMWEGPEEELTRTHNAQPAILTHSVAVHRLVGGRLDGVGFAAGHSLGEFSAYVASGAMSFHDAVRTVRRRGELMQECCDAHPGTMAAVIGLADEDVDRVCREASAQDGECAGANYNAPGQIVISGAAPAVERAMALAKQAGARKVIPLKVAGAFHSPLMAGAEPGLAAQLDAIGLGEPRIPVVANVSAEPVTDAVTARRLLVTQLRAPVRWTACMRTILDAGVTSFLELGPGSVLAGLMKRIERDAEVASIGTADEVEAFLRA
jgi:[acyl-carrier-protein] S-malonyltransferase